MKLARVLVIVAASATGCGGEVAAGGGTDAGGDATADASTDVGLDAESVPDGPLAFCSTWCGEVDAAGVPDAAGQTQQCAPGEICGETGGLAGFICCDPHTRADCVAGNPETPGCD